MKMRLSLLLIFAIGGVLNPAWSWAQRPAGLADLEFMKTSSPIVAGLQKIKVSTEAKDWRTCAQLSAKLYPQARDLKSWVLWQWIKCAQNQDQAQKNLKELLRPLNEFARFGQFDPAGTLGAEALTTVQNAMVIGLELDTAKNPHWAEIMNRLTLRFDKLERDKKIFFLTQLRTWSETQGPVNAVEESSAKEAPARQEQQAEQQAYTEFERSPSAGQDNSQFLKAAFSFLQKFPASKFAHLVSDRVQDSLQKVNYDLDPVEGLFRTVDPARLVDWSKTLFKNAHYEMAFRLSLIASEAQKKTNWEGASLAQAFFIQGKSAELLGRYPEAAAAFKANLNLGTGSDEAAESLFRLGLIAYRQQKFQNCVENLNQLLAMNSAGKYELQARYWVYRSLQKLTPANPALESAASLERDTILKKFPWTYYGLRLRLEIENGRLSPSMWAATLPSTKGPIWVTSEQKKIWQRAEVLAFAGWNYEAQKELTGFIWPQKTEQKLKLAQRLAELKLFLLSFRLVNEITDSHPELLNLSQLSFTFPQPYSSEIKELATTQRLDPILINSLIRQESAFSVRAVSSSNALGLMQLIPPTAQEMATELQMKNLNLPEDLALPSVNLKMGTHYIRKMIDQFQGCVPCGLAAYNAGPVRVDLFFKARSELQSYLQQPSSDPSQEIWFDELQWSETSYYVKAILRNSLIYRLIDQTLAQGLAQSEWTPGPVLWSDLSFAK